MSWIVAIADKIASEGLGTGGTDLFIGFQPPHASLQSLLTEYTGDVMETQSEGVAIYKSSLQVMTCGEPEDYATPRTRIGAIYDALVAITDETISGVRFLRVRPVGTINSLGQNDNQAFEFTANFEVVHE